MIDGIQSSIIINGGVDTSSSIINGGVNTWLFVALCSSAIVIVIVVGIVILSIFIYKGKKQNSRSNNLSDRSKYAAKYKKGRVIDLPEPKPPQQEVEHSEPIEIGIPTNTLKPPESADQPSQSIANKSINVNSPNFAYQHSKQCTTGNNEPKTPESPQFDSFSGPLAFSTARTTKINSLLDAKTPPESVPPRLELSSIYSSSINDSPTQSFATEIPPPNWLDLPSFSNDLPQIDFTQGPESAQQSVQPKVPKYGIFNAKYFNLMYYCTNVHTQIMLSLDLKVYAFIFDKILLINIPEKS